MDQKKILATGIDTTQLVVFNQVIKFQSNNHNLYFKIDEIADNTWSKISNLRNINYEINKRWSGSYMLGLYIFCRFFFQILTIDRQKIKLLGAKNLRECLLLSSWESASKDMVGSEINPKRKLILIHYVNGIRAYCNARLSISQGYRELWTGHLVYQFRMVNLAFQEKNLKTLVLTLDELRYTSTPLSECYEIKIQDSIALLIEKNQKHELQEKLKTLEENILYKTLPTKKQINKNSVFENIIYLHVLNDSPFHFYKNQRIFADYIDWIATTIDLVRSSSELWWIKTHPHSRAWNDYVHEKLGCIIEKGGMPPNLRFMPENIPSDYCLNESVKNVTFCGTIAKEAVLKGRKPIIINDCIVSEISDELCFRPQSIEEYENLLSNRIERNSFFLNDENKLRAKRYLEHSDFQKGRLLNAIAYAPAKYMHNGVTHKEVIEFMDRVLW